MTASGPDPGDRKGSIADENSAPAGQTSGPIPGPSARAGLSTSQAGPVGPCPSGRSSLETGGNQSVMATTAFLGCFGVANALEPPKPLRSSIHVANASSTSSATHPESPAFSSQSSGESRGSRTSGTRHLIDDLSDASSYDADSDGSSHHDHERAFDDLYEMPDDLVDDFVRDCSVEGQEQRPHSPDDHVSQVEFSTMRIEYLRRLLEQSVEAKVSLDKVNALNAELLVQRSELQAATERFSRINSALQCSICLDTLSRPHSLACGHIFCEDCLLQWFEMSLKCPACRANVSMRPAPAYAIKEIIALLNPHVGIESSPAPTSRTDGEAADPWALLFPARHELDTPGIYQDAARRTVAFEEEYRRATARSVGPDIEQDIQDMARRDRLSLLHNRLNLLTGGRTGPRPEALPLLASRLATHETNVVADTPLNTEDIYTEDANNSIALLASAISRQVESYQEYLRRPGASSTSEMSQNSYSYLRDITELSMRTILGDARRSSQDMADPLLQPPLRLPPRPARMSSGPISSQASSPRIPIPPPRERPTTRPVRPATRAAPGSSSSPSIPIPPLSRLRQPTRFVRPEGTPAATTASPAVTTAAAASGLSVRNPIRISHIINNNNSSSSNSNSQAAQNGAARASRLQSRDNVATPPSQVLADSNGRLTQYIYRLLMIYQRFNDFNESTGSQNTTRRAISPTRRMSRVLDRAELLHPSDDDDDNNEQAARSARLFSLRLRRFEALRNAVVGSSEPSTATAPRAATLPRRPYQPMWYQEQDPTEPTQRPIRVRRPLSGINGRQGSNTSPVFTTAPTRLSRQATQSLEDEPEDTIN